MFSLTPEELALNSVMAEILVPPHILTSNMNAGSLRAYTSSSSSNSSAASLPVGGSGSNVDMTIAEFAQMNISNGVNAATNVASADGNQESSSNRGSSTNGQQGL
jgi:hypothetical protein